MFLSHAGIVKAIVLPVASSLAGDAIKYGVDSAINYYKGNEIGGFDLAGSLHNAAYSLVWSNLPGKYIFEPFEMVLKKSDCKLSICNCY